MKIQRLFFPARLVGSALLLVFVAGLIAAEPAPVPEPQKPEAPVLPETAKPSNAPLPEYPLSAFASIGSSFAQSSRLYELGWNEAQIDAFIDGVRAALHGKAYLFDEVARQVRDEMGRRLREIELAKQQVTAAYAQPGRLEQYMKEVRKRLGLQKTDSGLAYRVEGGRGGSRPRPGDTIVFSCATTAADGTTKVPQLSSEKIRMKMEGLLPGLLEGLQMMTVDSKGIFVLPPTLSFGEGEWPPGADRGAPLFFEITLHEIAAGEVTP